MVAPAVPSMFTPIRSGSGWKGQTGYFSRPTVPMGRCWCLPVRARHNEDEVVLHREPPSRVVLPVSVVLDLGAVVEPPDASLDLLGL